MHGVKQGFDDWLLLNKFKVKFTTSREMYKSSDLEANKRSRTREKYQIKQAVYNCIFSREKIIYIIITKHV